MNLRKYDKCKHKTNWLRFRTQRNIVTNMRKKSMRIFMQNKCNVTKVVADSGKPSSPGYLTNLKRKMITLYF